MRDYDLIVLGTGGAGYQVAMRCRAAGWKVAVINEGLFGGTCSVRGCIPKKVLSGTAEVADLNRRLHGLGIAETEPHLNWQRLIEHKRHFTDPVPSDTEHALKAAGIEVFAGSPRFVDMMVVEINGQRLKGKKIHIATGAKPAKLPIEGAELLLDSDAFLELDQLPKSLIFVGGGYVSFEFAHIAARFGADVTILHGDDHPLPMFDWDIIQTLLAASKEVGIKIELSARVQTIEKHDDRITVTTADGRTFTADAAVHGAGRPPAISDLNLEVTNVAYDKRRGVLVDDYLRSTSNPDVSAGGNAAAAGPPLSSVATVHGTIAADNLLGTPHKQPSYHSTPSVIFSTPPAAKVGYLESEAQEKGIDFDATTTDLTGWFDSKRLALNHAKSKVLVEKGTHRIIGAHLIGNHAEEVINLFSLAIELGLTTQQLKQPIFAFPTSSDDARSMV